MCDRLLLITIAEFLHRRALGTQTASGAGFDLTVALHRIPGAGENCLLVAGVATGERGTRNGELATAVSAHEKDTTRALVSRVMVTPQDLRIQLHGAALGRSRGFSADEAAPITLTSNVRLSRSGLALRLIHTDGRPAAPSTVDAGLIAPLQRACAWWDRLAEGTVDIAALAHEEQVNDSWVSRVGRLNFLAPAIIEAILDGSQPVSVTAASLRSADIPGACRPVAALRYPARAKCPTTTPSYAHQQNRLRSAEMAFRESGSFGPPKLLERALRKPE